MKTVKFTVQVGQDGCWLLLSDHELVNLNNALNDGERACQRIVNDMVKLAVDS